MMTMNERSGMRTTVRLCGILIITIVLQSCTSFTLTDANLFQKGMSEAKVLDDVSKSPEEMFPISLKSDPSRSFRVLLFKLKLGSTDADYIAVFEQDKLFYWGHPYEFNRYPDPVMNEIGTLVEEKKKEF